MTQPHFYNFGTQSCGLQNTLNSTQTFRCPVELPTCVTCKRFLKKPSSISRLSCSPLFRSDRSLGLLGKLSTSHGKLVPQERVQQRTAEQVVDVQDPPDRIAKQVAGARVEQFTDAADLGQTPQAGANH